MMQVTTATAHISKATEVVATRDSGFSGKSGCGVSTSHAKVYQRLMWESTAVSGHIVEHTTETTWVKTVLSL